MDDHPVYHELVHTVLQAKRTGKPVSMSYLSSLLKKIKDINTVPEGSKHYIYYPKQIKVVYLLNTLKGSNEKDRVLMALHELYAMLFDKKIYITITKMKVSFRELTNNELKYYNERR